MISADIPDNEAQRLAALYDYQILDTQEEEAFDQLTELASTICGTPIALVSLIDDKRQWFKSHHGLAATETPREWAFCAHAMHSETVFEIQDSRNDERFIDNPLVIGPPEVIFYAGAPLITPEGQRLGTLCVIDNKPSHLADGQRRQLEIIAKQVVAQLELKKANRKREQTFAKLLELSGKLTARNEQLEQFVYTVSHDLKSPLVTISGFSQTLYNELSQLLSEKQQHRLIRIGENAKYMGELLDDLLALSRVMKVDHDVEAIDTLTVIDNQWQRLAAQNSNIQATLSTASLLHPLNANKTLLSQCVMNILSNAVRYREPSRPLTLRVYTQEDDDSILLCIEDNGIGIDEGNFERIFSIFQKVGKGEGTGIGLSIVKAAMEKHQGSVSLTSTLGVGSTFILTFPKITNVVE